jgi:uncharacterized membrane protein YdfJ with MMPL/SSD domain
MDHARRTDLLLGVALAVFFVLVTPLSEMQLVGRANWWMPRWLDRALPRLGDVS